MFLDIGIGILVVVLLYVAVDFGWLFVGLNINMDDLELTIHVFMCLKYCNIIRTREKRKPFTLHIENTHTHNTPWSCDW